MYKMKDSNIEWIGEIPQDWIITRLKYLISSPLQYGASETGVEYDEKLPRYIRITDITLDNQLKEENKLSLPYTIAQSYLLKDNDILFARSGATVGKSFIYKSKYGISAFAGYLIKASIKETVSPDFIYYYTLGSHYDLWKDRVFTQATIQNIGADKYSNLLISISSLSEQQRIASFLDEKCTNIDYLISKLKKQTETLEEYKRSVITETVTKGLNPDAKMKDSGVQWIGNMPEHWKLIKGKYILKYISKPIRQTDGIITCFRDGEVTFRSNRREEGFTMADKEIGYQGIDIGDLVVHGMDGFAGAIGISDSRGKASPVLNVLDTMQNKRYIMYYLRSMAYNDVFLALATGIRVRSCDLRWNKLAELLYPIPPVEEQKQIVEYVDHIINCADDIIFEKKQQIKIIEEYKKSLIYEVVTGKKEIIKNI